MIRLPQSILPVMDLLGGRVVHAVAGRRREYLPLQSCWARHADDPILLATAFRDRWGISEFYVADLDALEQQGNNRAIIEQLLQEGFKLWLDAGTQSSKEVFDWLERGISRVIVATELLPSLADLQEIMRLVEPDHVAVSLDLRAGVMQSPDNALATSETIQCVEKVISLGIRQLIILDLACVGTSQGPATLELCKQVSMKYPEIVLISGGGVRNHHDIQNFESSGVQRVLVSTWIHALP